MDASYIGKKISECRKQKGMTQKELAELLNITDKAVSKWERGLNFPDIALLEQLADALQISVTELLGIENTPREQAILDIAVIAQQEKRAIVRELITRGWLTIILGVILCIAMFYTSKILADNNLYGFAQSSTVGLSGFYGLLIANGIYSVWKGRKLLQ
ncbi:MAG: helix-turn-helix domain-containing protein [Lachnospiraceae bacterium]